MSRQSLVNTERVDLLLDSSRDVHKTRDIPNSNVDSSVAQHVRFADENYTQGFPSNSTPRTSHKQYLLRTDSGKASSALSDDRSSINSSHTSSGIVTDVQNSPKLSPACVCSLCANAAESAGMTRSCCSHTHNNSHHVAHPSNSAQSGRMKDTQDSTSVTSSTVCPSPIPGSMSYIPDTIIDEPLDFEPKLSTEPSFGAPVKLPPPIKGPFARYGLSSPHRGPAPPQDVRVVKGRNGNITVSWTPVR